MVGRTVNKQKEINQKSKQF